jgi:Helix-hairpin-helix domain
VAGSPRLDALVVAESEGGGVARVAAPAVPLEWTLTSGAVEPRCFVGDLAALLGRRSRNRGKEDGARVHREQSAISQVVPVAGGCRYEFSFRALADQSESVGEVLWRGDDCTLARADSIPIVEFEPSTKDRDAEAEPRLLLHRKALDPPPGTRQAEVRFTVPPGGLAAVGFVSLKGSDAVGINADLQQRENGRAVGWSVDSGGAVLTLGRSESGVVVANEEVETGALVQRAAVVPRRRLVVELVGRATGAGADLSPRLIVGLFDADDAPVGDPAIAPLAPQSFDRVLLATEVPGEAVWGEIRLELPAGARVELERIALRQEQDVEVPLVFRAEAPGELAVSTARVAFDTRAVPAPSVPAAGLCAPTAPGAEPGAEPAPACGCCGSHEAGDEARAVVTPAGRPAILRRCSHCGCRIVSATGTRVRGAPTVAPSRTLAHARGAGLPVEVRAAAPALTEVRGIGPVRARRLARVGIATVDRLASADPLIVAAVLRTVSPKTARTMIESARHLSGPGQ